MNPRAPARDVDLATEVEAWLEQTWDLELTVREWWDRLAGAGYAHPTWPEGLGGRGLPHGPALVISAALARNRVIGPPLGHVGATLAAPTLLEHGTPDQVSRWVGAIARGEDAWCQLFSEPGSGSDLASVGARAQRDGDGWVVTGQKVWNSGADSAERGMLLARTDPDLPKHQGMTYFVIDMHQPGVTVRPLRDMAGQSFFCEVFLDEARISADAVVGEVGQGWRVAQSTLAHERRSVSGGGIPGLVPARSGPDRDLELTVGEVIDRARRASTNRRSTIRSGAVPVKAMVELARDHGRLHDPVVRQELARYHSQVKVDAWTARRIAAARGRLTGADGSMAKLATARVCQQSRDLSYAIVGPAGTLAGPASPLGGDLQRVNLSSPGTRIGGGTDEIQLTVLGERALGLPREPGEDRDIPYRSLAVGTQS